MAILAEHLQKTALLSLSQHLQFERLQVLLLLLPVLQTPSATILDANFFKPVITPMCIENVIINIQ